MNDAVSRPELQPCFYEALRRFDEANSQDPNVAWENGKPFPREWLYAQRLTQWILKLCPSASEELRLAGRCQHLCRWTIPRADYPMTKAGYLRWRTDLKEFHAEKAGQILRETGYSEEIVQRVQSLNLKTNFPNDPESRVLEDALCLVFLEYQFTDLARKTSDEKMINALRKSWGKMTPAAREHALGMKFGEHESALLGRALENSE